MARLGQAMALLIAATLATRLCCTPLWVKLLERAHPARCMAAARLVEAVLMPLLLYALKALMPVRSGTRPLWRQRPLSPAAIWSPPSHLFGGSLLASADPSDASAARAHQAPRRRR